MSEEQVFAFVLMPFDRRFDDVYKLGIKEPAHELGILAERVDEQIYDEGVLDRIYRQIEAADIVVADMTGQNPNVFYEVGYAHAKNKLCILLTSTVDDIPFDLKHRRHIVYGNSIQSLRNSISEELKWAVAEIENVRKSHIRASLEVLNEHLHKTKQLAKAEIEFAIDLQLDDDQASPEIEAIYLHSGKGWTLYQDGKECPSTRSNVSPYEMQHLLTTPIKRLRKNNPWHQIRYRAEKILGSSIFGDELKDSYRISGRCLLQLSTPERNFDYELPVDVELEEIPF